MTTSWEKWCVGSGLEIGGANYNRFFGIDTRNVDPYPDHPVFAAEQSKHGDPLPIDIVAWADDIPVPDGSVDFVISSHVLEHVSNVIRTLKEWNRVVRSGGIIYMIVPHERRTFDRGRPLTPLSHIVADYMADLREPPEAECHQHVWRTDGVLEIIDWMNAENLVSWKVVLVEDPDTKVGNGFTIVCRKA